MDDKKIIDKKADESILEIINGKDTLLFVFGGMLLQFGLIPPFELLNFLQTTYEGKADYIYIVDKMQCWYHRGIKGKTKNIPETIEFLNSLIERKKYKKVVMAGISAGGYASILFSSLCKKVDTSLSIIPQTSIQSPTDKKYGDVTKFINERVSYIVHGDKKDKSTYHSYNHVECLKKFKNIKIIDHERISNLKILKKDGRLKTIFDEIL